MELNEIQQTCLGIAKDIDRVCSKHNIQYSLCGGSVIGAHLYRGFIPWDDDIDLMMTRENYDRFLRIYPKEAGPEYHLHHFNTDGPENLPALFARVEDTRTDLTEEIAGSIRQSKVFVDITVFDGVPTKAYHLLAHLYAGYVYTFLYRKNGMTPGTGWKKAIFRLLPGIPQNEKLLMRYKTLDRFLARRKIGKTMYCAELLSAAYSGILYESRIFHSYTRVPFESCSFMMIDDYKDYLFMRYGKREFQKELPPQERHVQHFKSGD